MTRWPGNTGSRCWDACGGALPGWWKPNPAPNGTLSWPKRRSCYWRCDKTEILQGAGRGAAPPPQAGDTSFARVFRLCRNGLRPRSPRSLPPRTFLQGAGRAGRRPGGAERRRQRAKPAETVLRTVWPAARASPLHHPYPNQKEVIPMPFDGGFLHKIETGAGTDDRGQGG